MGHDEHESNEVEDGSTTESENDSFDLLVKEVAHDSLLGHDRLGPDSISPRKGEVISGKYKIDDIIDSGGMGIVFAATDLGINRRVAIKWMRPAKFNKESVRRFRREARAAGRVSHRNVVHIYDSGEHNGAPYLVMELLDGESLSKLLQDGGVLSYRDAIALLMPVMRGVAAIHDEVIVHRDLKPSNIVMHRGDYKVLDFGVSKLLEQADQGDASLTTENTFVGTLCYCAPEQLDTDKRVDCRADVYSLGVILYELITGRLPFKAKGLPEMIYKIANESPDPPIKHRSEIPEALSDIVSKAISRNPENRFQSVREFAHALEPFADRVSFSSDETITIVRPTSFSIGLSNPFNKARALLGSTLALLLIGTIWIGAYVLSSTSEKSDPQRAKRDQKKPADETPLTKNETDPDPVAPKKNPRLKDNERKDIETAEAPTKRNEQTNNKGSKTTRIEAIPRTPAPPPRRLGAGPKLKKNQKDIRIAKKSASPTRVPLGKAVPYRDVTIYNTLHSTIEIRLRCSDSFEKVNSVPANGKLLVESVPRQDCHVSCDGTGDPYCFKLYANKDSYRIYRTSR